MYVNKIELDNAGVKNLHIRIKETDLSVTPADEVRVLHIPLLLINYISLGTLWYSSFSKEEMKNSRARKRIYELLSKAAAAAGTSKADPDQRELHFVFFRQPARFLESDERGGHVSGVNLEKTILQSKPPLNVKVCYCLLASLSQASVDFLAPLWDTKIGLVIGNDTKV